MHPEIAQATVTIAPFCDNPSIIDFSLEVKAVGNGGGWLETDKNPWGLGYVDANPPGIGIGTKIMHAILEYAGEQPFQSEVFHRDTLARLTNDIAQARRQLYQPIIITDERRLKRLPIVQFLVKAGAQIDRVEVVYTAHKYEELSDVVTLYGKRRQ